MKVLHESFYKVFLLEQKRHSAMDSSNAQSPYHIIWRGRANDTVNKKTGMFAQFWFRINKRPNAPIHRNGRQDSMIRANVGLDQVTGVHNDRILPDHQGQPQ
ncbi:MAG: hypothetical protein EZS28_008700 [Streblomastix strix]|uniref:Uncharacterized protein n=1 Tax=Streblomastix strix TaxID=222440 RepID=A0A5J4WLV5_9EUKA|nr:MAG: hypothetical protein EZS28_008700 [Streblomastix strix]